MKFRRVIRFIGEMCEVFMCKFSHQGTLASSSLRAPATALSSPRPGESHRLVEQLLEPGLRHGAALHVLHAEPARERLGVRVGHFLVAVALEPREDEGRARAI